MSNLQVKQTQGTVFVTHLNSQISDGIITHILDSQIQFNTCVLQQVSFSQVFYNICSLYGNNKIIVKVNNGASQTFTFSDGFYSVYQLMDDLKDRLNILYNSAVFDYTFSNFKLTFTLTGNNTIQFSRFSTFRENKIYDMLGFSSFHPIFSSNLGTSTIGNMPVNFQIIGTLKLRIDDIQNQYRMQQIDVPFSIPIDVEYSRFQTNLRQDLQDNISQRIDNQQQTLQQLRIQLLNEENVLMQVPLNFVYCFKFIFTK